jgi:hypothetical protein
VFAAIAAALPPRAIGLVLVTFVVAGCELVLDDPTRRADIPLPPGYEATEIRGVDRNNELDPSTIVAAARADMPNRVGRDPVVRFLELRTRGGAPGGEPTWIVLSQDLSHPMFGPPDEIPSVRGATLTWIFLSPEGEVLGSASVAETRP